MTEKTLSLKFNVPIFKMELLSANFDKTMAKNENFKLYDGIYEGLGPCTILVLYNIEKNIDVFYNISNQINIFSNLNYTYLAKLWGIIVDKEKFCLIFEKLTSSLDSRLKTKSIEEKEKFTCLIDVMEMVMFLHENGLRIYDLRPCNIFFNEMKEMRMIFPMENCHLFRDEVEDEDEMIDKILNPEDSFLRFMAPELLLEPQISQSCNDVWMTGCLIIECFSKSKMWEGYSETEIIKQLKNTTSPKVPNDIPKFLWGIICECLNPFHQTRIDCKELLIRFYILFGKLNLSDLQIRIQSMGALANLLPNSSQLNISRSANQSVINDDPNAIRKCQVHPKNMVDLFCTNCNDLICTKCQFSIHKDHNEEGIIVDVHSYIAQAIIQFDTFQQKFKKFIEISSANFHIDESVLNYISRQKNIIDVLYDEQKNFVVGQFDLFHKKIENLKELEINNLNKFRDFFKIRFIDLETKVTDLVDEKNEVEEFLEQRDKELKGFQELDAFTKEGSVRRIQSDMNVLKTKKNSIMNLFKDYQKNIGESDKIKRYFQRAVLNLKENKAYELIKVLERLHGQLDQKYSAIDLQEYMNTIIVELDEYALINSRNNAPKTIKEIMIACFKSRKVLSYNVTNNTLSIIEADFKGVPTENFLNFSRSINVNGTLFINGGWDEQKKAALKHHLSYELSTNKVIAEENMLYGHSAHSLIFVPPQYLYCISGSGIAKCEKYDMMAKRWSEVPELNFHRQNACLFYHNEQYLYTFGGLCWDDQVLDFVFVETVERLDIGFGPTEEGLKWDIVPTLKANDAVNISKSVMTVVPISSNKILLIGGMFKDTTYSDEIILFDFEKMEFSLLEDLKLEKATCFPNKYFLFFGDYAYQFDNEGDIHEFSVKDLSFKIVNHHKPMQV